MAETNKDVAVRFLKMASSGQVREAYAKFVDPAFRHHNAFFEGSAKSLMEAMEENARQNPNKSLEVKHALAEGEFVTVHAHVQHKPGDKGAVVIHTFVSRMGVLSSFGMLGKRCLSNHRTNMECSSWNANVTSLLVV